jgi:hypothetical protein
VIDILACIDATQASSWVICRYAMWAGMHLNSNIHFLYVTSDNPYKGISKIEEADNNQYLLTAIKKLSADPELPLVSVHNKNGNRFKSIVEFESELNKKISLLIVNNQSDEDIYKSRDLEKIVHLLKCPILLSPENFIHPTSFLIYVDSSEYCLSLIDSIIASDLLRTLDCYLIAILNNNDAPVKKMRIPLNKAKNLLVAAGFNVICDFNRALYREEIVTYCMIKQINLLVLGEYNNYEGYHWNQCGHVDLNKTAVLILRSSNV